MLNNSYDFSVLDGPDIPVENNIEILCYTFLFSKNIHSTKLFCVKNQSFYSDIFQSFNTIDKAEDLKNGCVERAHVFKMVHLVASNIKSHLDVVIIKPSTNPDLFLQLMFLCIYNV
jgi:hypothetical protein